ncbi:MAG: extracellular solute-binding protein, partial [Nitrospinota bacterium]
TWIVLPSPIGSHSYPMVTRIDYWKQYTGIDVTELFPPDVTKRDAKKIATFTYDAFLAACKKLAAAGHMFGNPISECTDANDWLCPLMASFGSTPVTEGGDIAIESDATLEGIEFVVELTKSMPKDVFGWDDASNNRWIISGKGSAIQNPPSAWAVAKRDRPEVASQLWHHDTPIGPKGHFRGALPSTYGLWSFSKNKQAAKDLLTHLMQKEQQWKLLQAAQGFDMPQIKAFYSHPIWSEVTPPVGGQYNYVPRGDERLIIGGWPAKPEIAAQIYRKYLIPVMLAKAATGEMSPKEAMQWAAGELEDYIEG